MYNTIVIDNFFDGFHMIENEFKKIPLFNSKEYEQKLKSEYSVWPGKRSEPLLYANAFLWQLINKEILQKSNSELFKKQNWGINSFVHLRLESDNEEDWIHKDGAHDLTMIVFLSKTNLKSGLNLYDEEKQENLNVKYVQNRAVLFDSKKFHKSALNFGTNIDNGRLTINSFIDFK